MLFGLMVIFCFFLLGFEKIVSLHGPPKFKCIICGSKSGSKLENVRRHLVSTGHKMRLAQLNDLAQNPSYQKFTGMNIMIEDLPSYDNEYFNEDIFTPILHDIPQSLQQDIYLSSNDWQAFTNGYDDSCSVLESEINMPLEELFDMISGNFGDNLLGTGPQSGLSHIGSQISGVISDWYPFPKKEVCRIFCVFYMTCQLTLSLFARYPFVLCEADCSLSLSLLVCGG